VTKRDLLLFAFCPLPCFVAIAGQSVKDRARVVFGVPVAELTRASSAHFIVWSETPHPIPHMVIESLEETFDAVLRFCARQGLLADSPAPAVDKLLVGFFREPARFHDYCSRSGIRGGQSNGIFDQANNVTVLYDLWGHPEMQSLSEAIERLRRQRPSGEVPSEAETRLKENRDVLEKFNRLVLRHEVAHQVLFNLGVQVRGVDNPAWFTEGLACQFEVPSNENQLPGINGDRLADLRIALALASDAQDATESQWQTALAAGKLVDLIELITDDQALDPANDHAPHRYAQAWSLVYSLLHEPQPGLPGIDGYVRLLSHRKPGETVSRERELADFTSSFGRPDESFKRGWLACILKLSLPH